MYECIHGLCLNLWDKFVGLFMIHVWVCSCDV